MTFSDRVSDVALLHNAIINAKARSYRMRRCDAAKQAKGESAVVTWPPAVHFA